MPSTKPPTIRLPASPSSTIPEPTGGVFQPARRAAGPRQQEIDRTLMLRQAVGIKPAFFNLDADAVDPQLSSDPQVYQTFWHGSSGDMSDPTVHCQAEKGKSVKAGKLSLAFLSEAQRQKYNRMHPDKPQVRRAGPVLRICAMQGKPLLMPVESFSEAYAKANRVRDCVLGERGADGRRRGKGESPESCAFKVEGRPLAVAGLRRKRRSQR